MDRNTQQCGNEKKERSHHIYDDITIPNEAPFIQGDGSEQEEWLPDIIYESSEYVVGIEHFQFDSSPKTRKGSKMIQAEFISDKEIYSQNGSTRKFKREANIDVAFSYDDYVKSLLKVFSTHANNIGKYRDALKTLFPEKKILLAFYIEDKTALGVRIQTERGTETMCLLYVNKFLDELSKYTGIDYIITKIKISIFIICTYNQSVKKIYESYITGDSISQLSIIRLSLIICCQSSPKSYV